MRLHNNEPVINVLINLTLRTANISAVQPTGLVKPVYKVNNKLLRKAVVQSLNALVQRTRKEVPSVKSRRLDEIICCAQQRWAILSVSLTKTLASDTKYCWISSIDTSIGIGIAGSQIPILVSVLVSLL